MRRIALYLDEGRLARLRGTPFEGLVRPMFGGGLYVLVLELDDALGEVVLRLGWTPGALWRISRRLLGGPSSRSWWLGAT